MIITYNWLKEFVDVDAPPQDLCHRLTMAGLEVDSFKELGAGLESVIVARLDQVDPHPDADRLTLCQVNTGSDVVSVVCGATNHKVGDLVALAQPGTVLPGDFKIKKSKIRGQVSCGMLCSEKELGLADSSEGIMILPEQLPVGQPVFDVMGWRDYQIEIGLTPNRPDCLSMIGVAREVAALYGKRLKLPTIELAEADEAIGSYARVDIENPQACPRYAARMIRGVKIGPSPDWMVRRLEAVGMRSINNIVDVTNYVMMELGHPLHAFDFRFVEDGRIVVKCAQEGDKFATLDGQEHLLSADDLMICDGHKAVALAGVMGGLNSEVQDDTETILLEAAYFNPVAVRRTSKRHGLHTESSHRFERGADVDMVPVALDRAAALMAELGDGKVLTGVVDIYPQPLPQRKVTLALATVHRTLDLPLEAATVTQCLESIGLSVAPQRGEKHLFEVSIPSFRPDLEREIDLIEEIARLYGYDKIPVTMPVGAVDAGVPTDHQRLQRKLRDMLVVAGFSETINYSFIASQAVERIGLPEGDLRRCHVPILNPLSEEQSVMRTSLVPSLLETVNRNLNYRSTDLRLFELRPVFLPGEGGQTKERLSLAAVMTGRREPEGWAQGGALVDFYDLKGAVEGVLTAFGLQHVRFAETPVQTYLHPGKSSALITDNGDLLGYLGEVHPRTLSAFDIEQPVYLLDLDAEELLCQFVSRRSFAPLSRFPDVSRDTALLVDEDVRAEQVLAILRQHQARTVEDMTLFDLYIGKGVPEGKKSMGIRIRYRDMTKTLTEEEVGKAHDRMISALCEKLAAEIR
ncbi:phenylalanine--tRNA ligase subunit beta [Pelovirga terrestris]|uniref:Phenylalanine--tRNA ligase beta subunit n=1 Tax=Pelovirga terrestris TaxID=2771352 RepID=A0A8J6UQJ9_9BACT|nr:phenylalanine--tRNA ligase subunit beta [Pelovirga terrestris]MBD1399061.1 phenylalanine--tRNA ligase subunit beta [Pelovirga terrestris]